MLEKPGPFNHLLAQTIDRLMAGRFNTMAM
jgi:hypothetical protein